ncbi:MAG: hypothetical protein RMJ34_07440 [candidate division WOR-3 bacterium]|nr:hypothetical protein [candidate division WOR-3 bacterium]
MGIRTPDRRIDKWNVKLDADTIKEHYLNQKPVMRTYFSDAARYFYDIETRTKAILDQNNITMSFYPMYYCFAREVGKKVRYVGYGGESLFTELSLIISKWVARGLATLILNQILREVFGISIPIS